MNEVAVKNKRIAILPSFPARLFDRFKVVDVPRRVDLGRDGTSRARATGRSLFLVVFFFWLNNFRLDKRKYFTRLLLRFRRVFFSAFVTVPDPITRTSSGFFDSNKFPYLALYPWGRGFIEFPSKTIRFCKIFLRNQSQLAGMIHRAWFLYYWPNLKGLTGLIR